MCGRYTHTNLDPHSIAQRFGVSESAVPGETLGRFNVCPTEPVLAVCDGEARALRWGLIPPWARKLRAGPEPINARAESLLDKRLFAPLIGDAAHRCLVLADGWYEWLRPEHPKGDAHAVPLHRRRRRAVRVRRAVARGAGGRRADRVDDHPHHDRERGLRAGARPHAGRARPRRRPRRAWLSPDVDAAAALEFLTPLEAARTAAAPANPAVNRAGVEGPELLVPPTEAEPEQLRLG